MTDTVGKRAIAMCCCLVLMTAGCGFSGVNSLPLPGAVGRGQGSALYHVTMPSVGTLEPNSPVMIGDVIVGSVISMKAVGYHADVQISVSPGTVVPANVEARIGQTSLLGSMHVALDPPPRVPATGRLAPGSTIGLNRSSIYPSTEETLAAVSSLVNGGGLAHFGDIVHNLNAALNGHEDEFRDLLSRLDDFVGVLDGQRGRIVGLLDGLNRFSATLAANSEVIDRALGTLPAAFDVLNQERPNITTALDKLRTFSALATRLVDDSKSDLVTNLGNLAPALQSLADVGPDLPSSILQLTTYPYTQNFIDRAIRGDYMNLFLTMDLTNARLRSNLLLGTRLAKPGAPLVPAPGDFFNYSHDPLKAPFAGPPPSLQNSVPPPEAAASPDAPGNNLGPVAPPTAPPTENTGG